MRRRSRGIAAFWIVAGPLIVVGAVAAARQTPKPPPKPDVAPGKSDAQGRPWHMTFEELVHNDATGEGEAVRVVATSDQDTVIKADLITWNDKRMTARAAGNLTMADEQADGTAERADIQYAKSKRLLILTGNVRMTLKPRKADQAKPVGDTATGGSPAGGSAAGGSTGASPSPDARRYPIEVTCDRVDYEYSKDRRHAVLTGNVRAVQKLKDNSRTLTAERAEWFGLEERVVISGPARVEDTKGRKGETPDDVTIYTREGQEGIRLRKGVYSMPIEDDGAPTTKPPDKSSPPPNGPSDKSRAD